MNGAVAASVDAGGASVGVVVIMPSTVHDHVRGR